MVKKYSRFMRATGFRALLTVGAIPVCGLSQVHAGNGPSKPRDPQAEMAAIQYNIVKGVRQLRTDFTDNQKFVELLLKASDEYVKFVTVPQHWADPKSFRPVAEAYRAVFKELKERLQGEWGRIFGDGPSRFPWNGHSDGATDLWRGDDLRRDMPVVLSLWDSGISGHICRTKVGDVPNDNRAYVPNDSPAYSDQKLIKEGKGKYKEYVLKFFNVSKLSKCREYLEKFFCAPVSFILVNGSLGLQEAGCSDYRKDVQLLLNLYADYYSLDAINVHGRETYFFGGTYLPMAVCDDFVKTTEWMVKLMVACYASYKQWKPEDQKWLCSLLDNIEANYYLTENLHTYCIQSYHLLRGYWHVKVSPYMKNYVSYTEFGQHVEAVKTKGLVDVFKEHGNPLPEATWVKFVNYTRKRFFKTSN